MPLSRAAPAKINLYLHVTGRRDDGYHRLDSLVAFASVGDEVAAAPADDLTLEVKGPFGPALASAEDNLVLRAARALAAAAGMAPRAALTLTKNLPPASGIGGGSADAAATLHLLVALWRLDPGEADLAAIALNLGADVPVCLAGRPAQMAGIGEQVRPAPALPAAWAVLAHPGVPLETASVFRRFAGPFTGPAPLDPMPASATDLAAALRARRNDLEAAAIGLCPVIGEGLAALAALPDALIARMSGSGATCFALFAGAREAKAGAAALRRRYPAWWITATPFIP